MILATLGAMVISGSAPAARGASSANDITNWILRGLPKVESHAPSAPHRQPAVTPPSAPIKSVTAPEATRNPGQEIQFEFGSNRLTAGAIETVKNLGVALNQGLLKDYRVFLIEGHTDAAGNPTLNLDLSKRRADAVKDFLVREMSVSSDRLQTVGKGSSEPAVPRNPFAAQNRRVNVVVVDRGA
jgi:outer membrane protein OmpA-like peptidoglycan-associated protein